MNNIEKKDYVDQLFFCDAKVSTYINNTQAKMDTLQ